MNGGQSGVCSRIMTPAGHLARLLGRAWWLLGLLPTSTLRVSWPRSDVTNWGAKTWNREVCERSTAVTGLINRQER